MTFLKNDIIRYRLEKSQVTFNEAKSLANNGFWNGAANRLYYSCFYSVIALLAKDDFPSSTHNGVRTEFFRRYIKTGIFCRDFSSLYTDLMGKRQESDYDDFHNFSEEDLMPLFAEVENFNKNIRDFILSGLESA
jgi:uncharacterized protein (UPF0332 family)